VSVLELPLNSKDRPSPELAFVLGQWTSAALRLGLEPAETNIVATLLTLELDLSMRASLLREGTVTRVRDLVAFLADRDAGARLLALVARLESRRIVQTSGADLDWPERGIALAPGVRAYLFAEPVPPARVPELLPRIASELDRVASALQRAGGGYVVVRGRRGSGRDSVLLGLLARMGYKPYLRTPRDLRAPDDGLEPRLSGRAAVWDGRASDAGPEELETGRRFLARAELAVALVDAHGDAPELDDRALFVVETDLTDLSEREQAFRIALARHASGNELARLARLLAQRSRAGIGYACRAAASVSWVDDERAMVADFEHALRALLPHTMRRGVSEEREVVPFTRLVLPQDIHAAVNDALVLARDRLLGFYESRRGVKALFVGPSGTGKTLAARAIATELGAPLFRVDLAQVVSKWVGETEKNLRSALEAAEAAGAVLLFDEGDALFGKRGTVQSGSDRYANTEASYLLQAIEAFDGVAIVTTNLRANIDPAYNRRFDVCVSFRLPAVEALATLWRNELGDEGRELSPDALKKIAQALPLAGGDVAAAARLARAHARAEGAVHVTEAHVFRAIQAELAKQGSALVARDFRERNEGERR
jgi:SpoVK/Ycf46/Vps4 family AAA+-type ATPase